MLSANSEDYLKEKGVFQVCSVSNENVDENYKFYAQKSKIKKPKSCLKLQNNPVSVFFIGVLRFGYGLHQGLI